jgi:hypothetical protein
MSWCRIHETNNCLECAIDRQTKEIVRAINDLKKPPSLFTKIKDAVMKFLCWG